MDQIHINDLLIRGILGINDWERTELQDIVVNLTLSVDLTQAARTDFIEATVNYRTLTKKIIAYVETSKRFTVEALAQDIAKICLEDERVLGVAVRVEKPGALRFAKSVGVTIERDRQGSL